MVKPCGTPQCTLAPSDNVVASCDVPAEGRGRNSLSATTARSQGVLSADENMKRLSFTARNLCCMLLVVWLIAAETRAAFVVNTWPFVDATREAWSVLRDGGSAVDAVVAVRGRSGRSP